jgi:hemoglobin
MQRETTIMNEEQIFSVVGEEGFARLVAAFYRQVYNDEILGPMYPEDDREGAEQRLRDFLIYRFGGPQRYIEQRGHPRLRARHMPFRINQAARDRWMQLMGKALTDCAIPPEAEQYLRTFLEQMSSFMINQG